VRSTPNYGVAILPGIGDGTFGPAINTVTASYDAHSATVCDLNNDGFADLAVALTTGSGAIEVLLGNGDSTFRAPAFYGTGSAESVTAGDFNRDGNPDLAITNSSVSILLGNGDGTFQTAASYAVELGPEQLSAGDLNGDGILDLAVPNRLSNTVSVLLGDGDGTFQRARNFAAGDEPVSVAVGDFNGDQKPDLAIGTGTVATAPGYASILINKPE
jgi:FG-GAP-like repeat